MAAPILERLLERERKCHLGGFAEAADVYGDAADAITELCAALKLTADFLAEAQDALCGRDDVCTDHEGNDQIHLARVAVDTLLAKTRGAA